MSSSKSSRHAEDFFSNVPDIADIILQQLPIHIAARTSILSKQWRRNWLSLTRLNFDNSFLKEHIDENGTCNWQVCRNIISSILFHHNGPIHEFNLHIPESACDAYVCLSQWLSFLSKNAIKRITLINRCDPIDMPSYIFSCSELVQLELDNFLLTLPAGFAGFPKLRSLVLSGVECGLEVNHTDIFSILIANCPALVTLKFLDCRPMDVVVIDAHQLGTFTFISDDPYDSLIFKDISNLKSISVSFTDLPCDPMIDEMVDSFDLLANGCQLEFINFNGLFCQYLAEGMMARPQTTTFNHLRKLCLTNLLLDDSCVLRYVYGMIGRCPYIKELKISVFPSDTDNNEEIECDNQHRLDYLVEAEIKGITGSSVELTLVKYLLAISSVLEKVVFEWSKLDTETELKMTKKLMGFPRASPKACLVCMT